MRHPHDIDVPLSLDRTSQVALPLQIAAGLRRAVESGVLRPGDPLPSTRTLAARLEVSRGTVVAAFDQLHGEGWLLADRGATRVDPDLARHQVAGPAPVQGTTGPEPAATGPAGAGLVDLRPGQPDVSAVVGGDWRAAWRAASAGVGRRHEPAGSLRLRTALAEHLRLARGTLASPDDLIVTAGVRDGCQLLLTALARRVGRPLVVAVEDPGYPALRRIPATLGHEVRPVPVDADGLVVEALARGATPDLVLVTPSHQYPLGGAMPVARRLDLLAWAGEHDVLVVEDDYDGELRFTGEPVAALAALDRRADGHGRHVVTLGSFATVLAPGLGAGHALLPPALRTDLVALREALGSPVASTVQDALTHYLDAGALRRHTARMRRRYRTRRDLAVSALDGLTGVRVRPMAGGLHGVVELVGADAERERTLVSAAADHGVLVAGMAGYWAGEAAAPGPASPTAADLPQHGLVVGLGAERLAEGLDLLREALTGS